MSVAENVEHVQQFDNPHQTVEMSKILDRSYTESQAREVAGNVDNCQQVESAEAVENVHNCEQIANAGQAREVDQNVRHAAQIESAESVENVQHVGQITNAREVAKAPIEQRGITCKSQCC